MVLSLIAAGKDVLAGMFMALSVYGGHNIPPAYMVGSGNGVQRDDDYRAYLASQGWQLLDQTQLTTFSGGTTAEFRTGGLYNARVKVVIGGITISNSWDAQGLVAVNGDRLVFTFRGTDPGDPSVTSGQAFLKDSLNANYKAFQPLLAATRDYLSAHPEITHVVVSGHSLGGALTDMFTLKDAASFRAILPAGGMVIESIASSGIPSGLPLLDGDLDPAVAKVVATPTVTPRGDRVLTASIASLTPPDDYIAVSNAHDRVRWAKNFGNDSTTLGLVPIAVLTGNLHMGGDIVFGNPNIDNADVSYSDPLTHPLDFRGFGANHNASLYWNDLYALVNDPLFGSYTGQNLVFGISDYRVSPDWTGAPISLFSGYTKLKNFKNNSDAGARALNGTTGADYVLGLSGNDVAFGAAGNDLLSGGDGGDVLVGGAGNDVITGGGGNDRITGGAGTDTLSGGSGSDTFIYNAVTDSLPGPRHDTITDFKVAQNDKLDLSRIGSLHLTGNGGADPFGGVAGEVHWWTSGGVTLVQVDTDGNGSANFEIALSGAPQLVAGSFGL